MEPILPDKAGDKLTFTKILHLIFLLLPRIPLFLSSREAVVDTRITTVRNLPIFPPETQLTSRSPVHREDTDREEVPEARSRWVSPTDLAGVKRRVLRHPLPTQILLRWFRRHPTWFEGPREHHRRRPPRKHEHPANSRHQDPRVVGMRRRYASSH